MTAHELNCMDRSLNDRAELTKQSRAVEKVQGNEQEIISFTKPIENQNPHAGSLY